MYQNGFIYPNFSSAYYPYGAIGGLGAAASGVQRGSLFGRLFGRIPKFSFSSMLGTTQKTLGVINQAIPVFYQIKPIWNNAKTMFRVMGALKEEDPVSATTSVVKESLRTATPSETPITPLEIDNQPQFFL